MNINKQYIQENLHEVYSLMDRLCETTLLLEAMNLNQIHQNYYSDMSDEDFWNIVQADPTYDSNNPQKKGDYTQWLLNLRKADKLDMNELPNAKKYLEVYDNFKNRIGGLNFNNKFTVADLGEKVQYFIDNPNEPTSKSDELRRIKAEGAETVYEDNEWEVIQIFTKEAAIWYGQGTKWCTAATESKNHFDVYVSKYGKGCLYVNLDKVNKRKYQFCFESCEFKNAGNDEVYFGKDLTLSEGLINFYVSEKGWRAAFICIDRQQFYDVFGDRSQDVIKTLMEENKTRYIYHLIDGSFTIPDGIESINTRAFEYCFRLTSITIPESVTWMGERAFAGCANLTSVKIPDSVKFIPDGCFNECNKLTSVTIGNSVTEIEENAFANCTGLISITIPDSVTEIGDSAFIGCKGLTSITIPDSVTRIGECAFYDCRGLTSITIPDSVTTIDSGAFRRCNKLTIYVGSQEQYEMLKDDGCNVQMINDRPLQTESMRRDIIMEALEKLLLET